MARFEVLNLGKGNREQFIVDNKTHDRIYVPFALENTKELDQIVDKLNEVAEEGKRGKG